MPTSLIVISPKGPGGHRENQSQRQLDAHPRPCHHPSHLASTASRSDADLIFGQRLMNKNGAESILGAYILRLICSGTEKRHVVRTEVSQIQPHLTGLGVNDECSRKTTLLRKTAQPPCDNTTDAPTRLRRR